MPVSRQLVTANEVARICKTRSHMQIVPKKILPDAFPRRRASGSPETTNWPFNGMDETTIKALGRWDSDTYRLYARMSRQVAMRLGRAIASTRYTI